RFANLLGANLKKESELNDKVDLSKLDKFDLVIFWGYNPMETNIKDAHYIQESRYEGVKFITLTPEYNQTARCSDLWIPIKSGSDDLVVMNLIYEIINNSAQKNLVTKYNKSDFSEYAPEKTEKITKINPHVIKQLAKQLAKSKNPKIICGNGYKSQENLNYLRSILGMNLKNVEKVNKFAFLSDFNGRYKAREDDGLPKEMVIATASSLFNKKPKEFKDTFLQEVKFIVCIDTKASESAIYADIVLPATGIYESWDIYNFSTKKEKLLISKPPFGLKNIGESKDEWSIFAQIAQKLEFIANKPENMLSNKIEDDTQYTASGYHDLSTFYQEYVNQNDVLNQMGTDELAYNIVRKRLNNDAINSTYKTNIQDNVVQEIENLPSTQEETSSYMYDFIFKKTKWNKNRNYSTSTLLLRLQRGEPIVIMNNVTAKKNGLMDAKKVMISNENGEFISRLKTSSSVPFDAVIMNDGWENFMFQDRLGYSEILSDKTKISVNIKRVNL
ncbi:MAG: molybdopterin-dependent oxidoreductase, partial [Epsilonproteobacteria bacterium]|nr:molybdopterin-dependent oxidoreductase [Campylobacterota bacterium]